jgi:valyl-tRNA synthetase
MPGTQGSIMKAVFPADGKRLPKISTENAAESEMNLLIELISAIRNIRGEMNISPSINLTASVQTGDSTIKSVIERHGEIIINLAKLKAFSINESAARPKSSATAVVGGATLFVPLEGVIDFDKETMRLEKEINKLKKELNTVSRKLDNENFLNKAPREVVEQVRAKHAGLAEKQEKLASHLDRIKEIET